MRRLIVLAIAAISLLSIPSAQAAPPNYGASSAIAAMEEDLALLLADLCERKPEHQRCQTAAPSPTTEPTTEPSVAPTATPGPTPTLAPTASPTAQPSPSPTPPPANNVLTVPTEYSTIQVAIDAARAGDYVEVHPGVYHEELHTVRAGVSIVGHAGAILEGNGTGRPSTTGGSYLMVEVLHDDTFVQGFEIRNSWRGVRCDGADRCRFGGLTIHDIGRTGIEISHNSAGAEVHGSHIYDLCQAGEGNCEAIYIGTARSASSWDGPDLTRDGIIAGNLLGPNISEGVDLKDDVAGFVIRDNEVTGAGEPNSGALNIRGHHNSLLRNFSHDNDGSGFRFGGTSAEPAIDNLLRDNRAEDNGAYGYKFIDWPQDFDASNSCTGNGSGCTTGD